MTNEDPDPRLPLSGLRVLDLSRILAGPMCTMVLGDLGADVLKIESPGGDETRRWGPPFVSGESAYFLSLNRGKRSLVLDLKSDDGRWMLARLIGRADVLIDNFRPGTLERWGFDAAELSSLNPRLVHCSITGFGSTGPYHAYPGFDPVIEAMSGLMSINGPAGREEPYKVGVAVVDVLAALHASTSVLSLIQRRQRTGRGGRAEISLLDVALAGLANVAGSYLVSGLSPERFGNDHPSIVPFGVFDTADRPMMICAGSDAQWLALAEVVGLEPHEYEHLGSNEVRVAHRADVRALLAPRLKTRGASEWSRLLMDRGVPAGSVNSVGEAFDDEHVRRSGLVQELAHPTAGAVKVVGPPLVLDGHRVEVTGAPPLLDDASDQLSDWLGDSIQLSDVEDRM